MSNEEKNLPTEAEKVPKGSVKIRAVKHLQEEGKRYSPGDEFTTPAKRAKALGNLVEPVK